MNSSERWTRAEKEDEEEWVMENGERLESGVAGHFLMSQQSLIQAQEHISIITVSLPVTTSLDYESISSQSIKIGCSSSP